MNKTEEDIAMKKKKYMFDKSIQARYEHIHFYNHWMNMYAIFNGALFVCLYTLVKECKCWDRNLFLFLEILTSLLGVIAGWCWHFSSKGFYDWLLSYIKNTNEHENNLKIKEKDKVFNIFYGKFKNGKLAKNPYSTQKLTQCFTLFVALSWSVIFVLKFYSCLEIKTDWIENIKKVILKIINCNSFWLLFLIVIVTGLFVFLIHKYCQENLEEDGVSTFDIKK